jgi:hypothetical protein
MELPIPSPIILLSYYIRIKYVYDKVGFDGVIRRERSPKKFSLLPLLK